MTRVETTVEPVGIGSRTGVLVATAASSIDPAALDARFEALGTAPGPAEPASGGPPG
jgi:hypothetical protein